MVSLRMRWPNTGDKIQGKVVLSNVQITIVVLMINVSAAQILLCFSGSVHCYSTIFSRPKKSGKLFWFELSRSSRGMNSRCYDMFEYLDVAPVAFLETSRMQSYVYKSLLLCFHAVKRTSTVVSFILNT